MLSLKESGELLKLRNKWWFDKTECNPNSDSQETSTPNELSLSNVAGIYYILIGGLLLSVLVAILEFFCRSKTARLKVPTNGATSGMLGSSTYQRDSLSDAIMQSQAKLAMQAGSDYDERLVGVEVGDCKSERNEQRIYFFSHYTHRIAGLQRALSVQHVNAIEPRSNLYIALKRIRNALTKRRWQSTCRGRTDEDDDDGEDEQRRSKTVQHNYLYF